MAVDRIGCGEQLITSGDDAIADRGPAIFSDAINRGNGVVAITDDRIQRKLNLSISITFVIITAKRDYS